MRQMFSLFPSWPPQGWIQVIFIDGGGGGGGRVQEFIKKGRETFLKLDPK